MSSEHFPIDKWGIVLREPGEPEGLLAVCIEASDGGGFLILTREARGDFDTWVETVADVRDFLSAIQVEWDA